MTEPVLTLDHTFQTPEENLACDEALFLESERHGGNGILRFWEPDRCFVVVGYTNSIGQEVREDECLALGVPIFRRCTGGGAVVQMEGCLNYALVLPLLRTDRFDTIASTNRTIMTTLRDALRTLRNLSSVSVEGISDLALDGLKFAGNAQRRGKHFLLFHGVILNDANLSLIPRLLQMPSRQPLYRQNRSHADFLTNLRTSVQELKHALEEAWGVVPGDVSLPTEEIRQLVDSKYKQETWIFKR